MPRTDLNADGRDDILWLLGGDLAVTNWLGTPTGGFIENNAAAYWWLTAMHHFQYTVSGDFNGDDRTDIIWLVDDSMYFALPTGADGSLGNTAQIAHFTIDDPNWRIAGVGDFNGDGIDDILFRHELGALSNWLGTTSGAFVENHANAMAQVSTDLQVEGIGDFNGDGRDDILWRSGDRLSNWLGTANGSFAANWPGTEHNLGSGKVAIGDFDGDGHDDLLWRNDQGEVFVSQTYSDGAFMPGWAAGFVAKVPLDQHVEAIGDYNGDGLDDILWRSEGGVLTNWLGTQEGQSQFTTNEANVMVYVPNQWEIGAEGFVF